LKSEFGNHSAVPDRRPIRLAELSRWTVLIGGSVWLAHPFFPARLIGTGDALWYHHSLADAVLQFRAGVFPVFVGQSDFSFNGSIYPLRAAPYFQYMAGMLDLLTGRHLGFFALEHLTAILSLFAGTFVTYRALVWISPRQRWSAAALALLYVMCPGVSGLFYAQDLYMSGMAIPWIPLAFAASLRSFEDDRLTPMAVLAMSLAALWWAHSPIALWATVIAAFSQLIRLATQRAKRGLISRCCIAAAIFAALAAYPIGSVFLLRTPGEAIVPYIMDRELLLSVVRSSFPSSVLPLDLNGPILGFLQLGYGLWLLLIASLAALLFRARILSVAILLGSALGLLILLFPIPWLNRSLWQSFPETVVGMTLYWPMQRFYVLIAAATVVSAQRLIGVFPPQNRRIRAAIIAGLLVAGFWGTREFERLIELTRRQTDTVHNASLWSRPENVAVQRHTYGLFPRRPAYFTHGVVEPRMESRLLDFATGAVVASDYEPVGPPPPWREFATEIDSNPGIINLKPPLTLRPGGEYLLTFDFARQDSLGVLQIIGPEFYREYTLPRSGELKAFGSTVASEKSIILWTSGPGEETVNLRFIPTGANAKAVDFLPFAKYRLQQIDEQKLPIQVSSLIPYRATVRSAQAALLETPRMYIPGYEATVNGRAVPTVKSREGLVAFPVPAGESRTELRYAGPFALHLTFWVSAAGWVVFASFFLLRLLASPRKPHA
jgi:hypothetical protein